MVARAKGGRRRVGRIIFAVLTVYFFVTAAIAATNIISTQKGYAQASVEYSELRQYAPVNPLDSVASKQVSEKMAQLQMINPDCIGWIQIEGTSIDYPIVLGKDNNTYLHTTFSGNENYSGAIFMDYRCRAGFDDPVAILYGHNMKDGSMFADLNRYLENGYREAHPKFTITTLDGKTRVYTIYFIKDTDMYDDLYTIPGRSPEEAITMLKDMGVPPNLDAILLSTCTNSGGSTGRLLIYAMEK